jgi:outer membrane lipoprotein-sorting protein
MKRYLLLFLALSALALNGNSQNDPDAVAVLDKFSSKAASAPSVSMKFILTNIDLVENTRDSLAGSVIINKDNYKLDLPNNIVWFNGETSWSYLLAEQEVTITRPSKKDNSFMSQPSLIFSIYKKGYKSRLIEEKPDSYQIDLYPADIKSDIIRVRLLIEKPSLSLKSFEYKRRDGISMILKIQEYKLTEKPDPATFVFPSAKYKDAEVVDMR